MRGKSSMTGLTSHTHMAAQLFRIHDIAMASLARFMAGEGDRPSRSFGDRVASKMPVLSETGRHDSGAQDHKRNQCYGHDGHESEEVLYILK